MNRRLLTSICLVVSCWSWPVFAQPRTNITHNSLLPTACSNGDVYIVNNDAMYWCMTAGNPGTWAAIGSGGGGITGYSGCADGQIIFHDAATPCDANLTWAGALNIGDLAQGSSGSILDVARTTTDNMIQQIINVDWEHTPAADQGQVNGIESAIRISGPSRVDNVINYYFRSYSTAPGDGFYGFWLDSDSDSTVTTQYGFNSRLWADGTHTNSYNFYANNRTGAGADGTSTNWVAYYTDAVGSAKVTNAYAFWADEQGVFRIRADNTFNSVYQAIPALYNPQFTKYTAGAADYERCIPGCQWESNVAVITTEKGGSGTLRDLKLGDGGGANLILGDVTPAMSGTRYLCISTAGVVTSSALACSGT